MSNRIHRTPSPGARRGNRGWSRRAAAFSMRGRTDVRAFSWGAQGANGMKPHNRSRGRSDRAIGGTRARCARAPLCRPAPFGGVRNQSCPCPRLYGNAAQMSIQLNSPRIDPLLLEHTPEVLGQAARQIFVRQPALAVLAPTGRQIILRHKS